MRAHVHIYARSLQRTSVKSDITWQKSIKSAEFGKIRSSVNFAVTFVLAEFRRISQNSIELAELGKTHLLSVSPRHSYCNWASPVTARAYKIQFNKDTILF